MKFIKQFIIVLLLSITLPVIAQKQTITGKITDASNGTPLEGVSVRVRSSGAGALTDKQGAFTVQANTDDALEISYIGYTLQTVKVNNRQRVNVQLESSVAELGQIVLVGTRGSGRIKTETPVPVDVVNVAQAAMPTARMDLTSIINYAAPSFNYNKQSGSDGADHIDLATLRGLGPDQTLVLINGKRRHQTAFVAVFGTRGRGNSGTDLNAIPVTAIDRVEILRDGASAQYGSDAIAGVINLILKKDVNHFTINAGYSGYYDRKYNTFFDRQSGEYVYGNSIDGNTFTLGTNYGFNVGKKGGFINLTGNVLRSGKTFRQVLNNNLEDKISLPLNIYRRANGDGSLTTAGGFLNMELPVGAGKTSLYAFGGYNYKASDAYAFTRNYSARPDRFPSDINGNLIFDYDIMKVTRDSEIYFNPHIQTQIQDASLAAGIKGVSANDWSWDLSNTTGDNNFHFYGDKTFNASLPGIKTRFDDGGFNFLQNTTNLNFSKNFRTVASGLNLAFGAEFRYERYKINAGEEASYKNYDPTGEKASGSQGFPGYQPNDEVNAHRSNIAAYADIELDVSKKFLIGGAMRVENYSDFGFTSNYKIDARLKATHNFNIRGSFSTGFRAPSLQQINFSSTFTTVQGGNIAEVKIAPNYSPITKAAGIDELKQEKSLNASLGFTWKPVKELSITIDGYWVQVKDRVVLSGQFSAGDATLNPELTNTLKQLHVSLAQFFANAVNTTNKGIDMVIDYNKQFGKNHFRGLFTGNVQDMTLDKINVPSKLDDSKDHRDNFLSDREQKFILASAPPLKLGLTLEYGINWFTIGTRLTYFGKIDLYGYGEDGLGINPKVPSDADENVLVPDRYIYNGKLVTDLYTSFKLCKSATLYLGADNIFNVHPDLGYAKGAKGWAFNNETGGPWDAVQMGGNGIRFFTRIGFNF